jgi:glucosylceramidase
MRRRPVRNAINLSALTVLSAAVALLGAGATSVLAGTDAAASPAVRGSPVAHVWVTTPDGQLRFSDQGTIPFRATAPSALTVTVDPGRSFQRVSGFGGSITDSSAYELYQLDPQHRAQAMTALFDPNHGDGLSYLRQPMGGSDFVVSGPYTYDDMPSGETDYGMRHFNIAHDQAQILPLLRQAETLNPQLRIMATPWSPPAWMKTNGSLIGGRLIDDPRIYRAYALYFVKFIQAYTRAGVPIDAITVQNEPQNRTPSGYPGTDMSVAQETKLIEALGPALRAAGLHTKILSYDHNWSEHPNDIASTPPDEQGDLDYPVKVLSDPAAARWISGTAYHCYYGDPAAMTTLHTQFPDKQIYFTECSGSQSSDPANTFSDTLKWHARNLIIGSTRNWAQTVINWNIALDPSGGPHVGGCGTCTPVLTIGPGQSFSENAEYYTLGHLSRFVKPGAVRIASTSFGTTGWNGQIMDVAFRNPDGSTALIVHNENDNPATFAVAENGYSFTDTLPGGALATFTWPRSSVLEAGSRAIDPSTMTATAQPPGPTDPCCTGDVAAGAVDDDASTRWSTGQPQQPGQYLQIDFGRPQQVRTLVLDTGASTGDYPRGYAVSVSDDGVNWTGPVAAGAGSGQLTSIKLPPVTPRFVRVTLTASSASWWSVADVRAYASG